MEHQYGTPASSAPSCRDPFDRGPEVCAVCNLATRGQGLKRCSRLVAESPAMRRLLLRARPIAASEATVIVLGESGTGKEVLARALHANSRRAGKPFLAVNVAALPAELLESELFGHARGAFTGASSAKDGLFQAAEGGTLLLDEVGEMPLPMQVKLLRALQDGEVRRVGETRSRSIDVRILAATHQDLRAADAAGRFREDLYYRLRVFTLVVPPLRERREDLLPLARMLLLQHGHSSGRIGREAVAILQRHAWPGNVRELGNAMTHAAVLAPEAEVRPEDLPEEIGGASSGAVSTPTREFRSLREVEREHVERVLAACGGRAIEAARILGIGRTTLWRKLKGPGTTRASG